MVVIKVKSGNANIKTLFVALSRSFNLENCGIIDNFILMKSSARTAVMFHKRAEFPLALTQDIARFLLHCGRSSLSCILLPPVTTTRFACQICLCTAGIGTRYCGTASPCWPYICSEEGGVFAVSVSASQKNNSLSDGDHYQHWLQEFQSST